MPFRLLTMPSRPRRLAWSFLCRRMCSVNWLIRSVNRAIWTSGDPVSDSLRRNFCMIPELRSFVLAIAPLTASVEMRTPAYVIKSIPSFGWGSILGIGPTENKRQGEKVSNTASLTIPILRPAGREVPVVNGFKDIEDIVEQLMINWLIRPLSPLADVLFLGRADNARGKVGEAKGKLEGDLSNIDAARRAMFGSLVADGAHFRRRLVPGRERS